jgi:hypothetical protein
VIVQLELWYSDSGCSNSSGSGNGSGNGQGGSDKAIVAPGSAPISVITCRDFPAVIFRA